MLYSHINEHETNEVKKNMHIFEGDEFFKIVL